MYTIIKVGGLQIEIAKRKEDCLCILKDFLKNKIVINSTKHKSLGMFNSVSQLTSKLIQHLENLEEEQEYPSTIWVHSAKESVYADALINIAVGDTITLSEDEIKDVKSGKLDFDLYGAIHKSRMINIDNNSTINNMVSFKSVMEKRFNDYQETLKRTA
jgi:hypothetical protein